MGKWPFVYICYCGKRFDSMPKKCDRCGGGNGRMLPREQVEPAGLGRFVKGKK